MRESRGLAASRHRGNLRRASPRALARSLARGPVLDACNLVTSTDLSLSQSPSLPCLPSVSRASSLSSSLRGRLAKSPLPLSPSVSIFILLFVLLLVGHRNTPRNDATGREDPVQTKMRSRSRGDDDVDEDEVLTMTATVRCASEKTHGRARAEERGAARVLDCDKCSVINFIRVSRTSRIAQARRRSRAR